MNKPLVSVIVPIYKVEAYLDQCIESIVNQTYPNLEILLIDDGSPDGCGTICDRWAEKDPRIRVVHKENGGLSDARNTGMALATGEFLMMPDSDDYLLPNTIQTMVNYALDHHAQCVLGGYQRLYPDGSLIQHSGTEQLIVCHSKQEIEYHILRRLLGAEYTGMPHLSQSSCMKLYSRQSIEEQKLYFHPTKEVGMEDFYFNIQFFSRVDSAVIIPENNYIYRYNNQSISSTFNPDRVNCMIRLYHRLKQEPVVSGNREHLQMLSATLLGIVSVHIKQIVASCMPHKISMISQEMSNPAVREMLSVCAIPKVKFPLSLFCFLMKYRMKYTLYLLIRLFLLLNKP